MCNCVHLKKLVRSRESTGLVISERGSIVSERVSCVMTVSERVSSIWAVSERVCSIWAVSERVSSIWAASESVMTE